MRSTVKELRLFKIRTRNINHTVQYVLINLNVLLHAILEWIVIEVVNSSIVVIMYTVFQALSKSYHRGMFNNMYIAERLELHAG